MREPNIPAEYQEVEYIQGSGTQYIDAGLAVKDGFKIICNTEFVSWGTYMCLGGYLGQSGGIYYRLYGGVSNTGKWAYGFLGNYSDDLGSSSLNTKYKLELHIKSGNNYFKVNDTTMASGAQTFSTSLTGNIGILAGYADDASGKWNKWSAKMYDYKIRDNGGTLIRDFVPCFRKSDNVIGMYDTVNNQFYTNAGSGTFTKGNDVAPVSAFNERQFYPGVPPTPPGPSYTTILDVDFTNTTDSALTSLGFRSIGVNYGLRSETGTGLRWVNYQTDVAAGVEFDYADSLVGKILAWECEVSCGNFGVWGNVNLNISNPRNYSNMSDRYSNLANFGMTGLPGFNSNQYTGVNGGGYWDPTNGSIEGDKSGGLYWDNYGTYHLGLPFTTGIYKMTGSYNFSTWQFTNTWETPNGTLATWTRDFSACTAAQKTIMNNFLATTNKQFILQESRGYGNSSYDVNYWRKLKIKVA